MYKFEFIKETSLLCTGRCLKQIFENLTLCREAPCRSAVNRARGSEETSMEFAYVTRHLFKVT
jgi:hypothetical protein